MAIEIKELNVKLHLNKGDGDTEEKKAGKMADTSHDKLVEDVVSQVLNILKEQQER
ncbi:MAG: DUF5908 family protein [Cyclobacteriaceae bacterium]